MKVFTDIEVIPIGKASPSMKEEVEACVRIMDEKLENVTVHATGTVGTGELEDVLNCIPKCLEAVHEKGAPRVAIDCRIVSEK